MIVPREGALGCLFRRIWSSPAFSGHYPSYLQHCTSRSSFSYGWTSTCRRERRTYSEISSGAIKKCVNGKKFRKGIPSFPFTQSLRQYQCIINPLCSIVYMLHECLKSKLCPIWIVGIVYANGHPFCQSIIISCRDRQRISHVAFLLSIHLQAAKQSYSFYIEKSKNDYKPNLYPTESVSM